MKVSSSVIETLNQNINKSDDYKSKDNGLFNTIFASANGNLGNMSSKNSYDNFKEIAPTRDREKTKVKKDRVTIQNNSDKYKYKKKDVEKTDKSEKTDKTDKTKDENDKTEDTRKIALYNEIASFLGITVEQLQTQMQEMGISEESLNSLQGIREMVVQLADLSSELDLLNLDGVKELFANVDNLLNMDSEGLEQFVKQNPELLEKIEMLTQNAEQITAEVSTEVDEEVVVETTVKNQEVVTETGVKNQEVEQTSEETVQTQVGTTAVDGDEVVNQEEPANRVLEAMKDTNAEAINLEAGMKDAQSQTGSQTSNGQTGSNQGGNTENSNNVVNNIMFAQDAKSQATTFNTIVNNKMTANVNTADVINQIVEKMKFSINGDTSEVRIHLRPEHLGDVTLKIATHNGVVTAEFLAESEQVKALIEANFQDLQETLRQKGIEVSEFTTSLLSENNRNESDSDGNRNKSNRTNNNGVFVDSELEEEEQVQEIKLSNYEFQA